jgi:hypothetical protein
VADCGCNGVRIGTLPHAMASKSRHESRYQQKQREMFLAAHALVAANLRAFDLSPSERPDFELRHGAETVGVEVAELVEPESARTANAAENMRIGIRELLDTDQVFRAALGDRFLSLSCWVTPKRSKERIIVEEYRRFVMTQSPLMLGSRVNDNTFPMLKTHEAHIYIGQVDGGFIDITTPPSSFSPTAMVPVAAKVLERKKKKAITYTGARLWLVMSVTDMMGVFDDSVEELGGHLPQIAPFELVLIRSSHRLALWTAAKHGAFAV